MSLWLFKIPCANPKLSFGMTGVFRYAIKAWCLFSVSAVRMSIISTKNDRLENKLFDNRIVPGFETQDSRNPPSEALLSKHLEGDSRPPCGGVD